MGSKTAKKLNEVPVLWQRIRTAIQMDDGEELEMGLNLLEEDCPSWLCNRGLPFGFTEAPRGR